MRRTFAATVVVAMAALATAGVAAADDGLLGSALDGNVAPVVNLAQSVVAPVLEPLAETASELVTPVIEAAAPVVETVDQATAPVIETVGQTVAPVVETVGQTVAPVVEGVKEVVAPVVELVDETLAPVVGTVENGLPPAAEPSGGSGTPSEPAAAGMQHPASNDRTPPPDEGSPALHGSVAVPASIMATTVAQALDDGQTSVTARVHRRSADPTTVDASIATAFSTTTIHSASAATLTHPELRSTPSRFDRLAGSLTAFVDHIGAFVASNASWAAVSISVAGAAALVLVALMVFPGLWLRLRAVSDRSPPFLTVSLLERPG